MCVWCVVCVVLCSVVLCVDVRLLQTEGEDEVEQPDGKAAGADSGKPKDGEGANANTPENGGEVSVCVCVCCCVCSVLCVLCILTACV